MRNVAELRGDTLIVADGESYLVYSPYRDQIARVVSYPEPQSEIENRLRIAGFFGDLPDKTRKPNIEDWEGFSSLTLFLTRQCNLRCVYCYGCPGIPQPEDPPMSETLALDAVDWYVSQLVGGRIRIGFHGGGEPTLEWRTIMQVVDHTEKLAAGRRTSFLITTNGTCDKSFLEWMIDHQFAISISMDGPPDIQDRNRPMADGGRSSVFVEQTVQALIAKERPFTVRMTFTPGDDIEATLRYFHRLGVRSLHLEPLFPYGRNFTSAYSDQAQNQIGFVRAFLQAVDLGKTLGMRIYNSHISQFRSGEGYFCGAACGKSMLVTHDGYLVGCLEVVDGNDSEIGVFRLGLWTPALHRFEVDRNQLELLRSRHADSFDRCKKCFARYHCAGGCAVKTVRATGKLLDRDRSYCSFTKLLVPEVVRRIAVASRI